MAIKAVLTINGVIGEKDPTKEMFGITEENFSSTDCQNFLNENKDADEIDVVIKSNGGSVDQGLEIYDMLIESGKKINTFGYRVKSIATVVFLAGSTRSIAENASPVIHNPRIDGDNLQGVTITSKKAQELADELKACDKRILDFYAKRLNLDATKKSELAALMDEDKGITAKEFKDLGFATDIIKTNSKVAETKAFSYSEKMVAIINDSTNNNTIMKNLKAEFDAKVASMKASFTALAKELGFKAKDDGTFIKETVAISYDVEDGSKLFTDAEAFAVGVNVFSDEAMTTPAADGDYKGSDGDSMTVAGGVVTALSEVDAAAKATQLTEANETIAKQNTNIVALRKQLAAAVTEKNKYKTLVENKFVALAKDHTDFMALVPGAGDLGGKGNGEKSKAQKHWDSINS